VSAQTRPASLRVGELRPNQLLHTYGVGSVADLPNLSVLVLGLESWELAHTGLVAEERLLAAARAKLGPQIESLRTPPHLPESNDSFGEWTRTGVPVTLFPRWLRCSDTRCNRLGPASSGMFELIPNRYSPERTRYVHSCRGQGNRRPTAVPARFLLACQKGHLDDFPWLFFVHRGGEIEGGHTLKMVERGTSGEAANLYVECTTCQMRRAMSEAFGMLGERNLPACRGRHPQLATYEPCDATPRTMALGATNSWFAMQLRVFSLPRADEPVDQLVAEQWPMMQVVAGMDDATARLVIPTQTYWPQAETYGLDEVLSAIRRRAARGEGGRADGGDDLDLAGPEWQAFTVRDRVELPDFTTRPERVPVDTTAWLDKVVLVSRLREVSALYGFTRIDAPDWEAMAVQDDSLRAPIAENPTWLPCAETRGEGIFLKFREQPIAAWEAREDVAGRSKVLHAAHGMWCDQRAVDLRWPGMRYLLIHTFAHALIREFALECGYSASGISERIYARGGEAPMAGLLLYTSAPDSEGTLGGLVSLGRSDRLGTLITQALDAAKLCSSDPLCAEHDPTEHGRLHGAACHACLFAAETSCEIGNQFLDRALIVDTLGGTDFGFFTA
jgi:Domain of unknown function (DUF1998)